MPDKMSAIVELLISCLQSSLSALTGLPRSLMHRDRAGRWVLAKRCAALDHKTAPRLQILAVPSRDGRPPDPTRLCQKDTAGCPDLFGDPRGSRERAARLGRAVVLLRGLAAQLCVSRGTLRVAYERLSNSSCRRTVVGCWNWRDSTHGSKTATHCRRA
jgi:hypothetical protein